MLLDEIFNTDRPNPALYPGETLTVLPGGDYMLSNDEHCWVYTRDEWAEYATDFVADLKATDLIHYMLTRFADESMDTAEIAECIAGIRSRAEATEAALSRAVKMWTTEVRYREFLIETLGHLPAMPEDWMPTVQEDDGFDPVVAEWDV